MLRMYDGAHENKVCKLVLLLRLAVHLTASNPLFYDLSALSHFLQDSLHVVSVLDEGDVSRLLVPYRVVRLKVLHDRLFRRSQRLVKNPYKYSIVAFFDDGHTQAQFLHFLKSRIQPLSYILVGWVREFIEQSNYDAVSSKPLLQNIVGSDM